MGSSRFEQIYAEFESSIASPDLKRVAQHWRNISDFTRLPRWRDIQPTEIKGQLPIVWCYDFDAGQGDFVGRLAGLAITGISTKPFKGTPLSELRPAAEHPRSLDRAKRVVQEPALYRGSGLVYKTDESYGFGERIMMPLGEVGADHPGIFGATIYESFPPHASRKPQERTEVEHWFSLAAVFSGL